MCPLDWTSKLLKLILVITYFQRQAIDKILMYFASKI